MTPARRISRLPHDRPVLVCPDKFRGSLSGAQVAGAIAAGLSRAGIESDICAVADGGEGTIEVLHGALEGVELVTVAACDALERPARVEIAVFGGGRTALVESARAIGLTQLAEAERDAWRASSRGAGMAIAAAAKLGVKEVLVGIGGTASTDGGRGALEALREAGLPERGGRHRGARWPKLVALCDVRAGWNQAVTIFAAQKGADARMRDRLAARLRDFADELPHDPRTQLMAGAGGGLAGGLWATVGAELKSGAGQVLDLLGFNERLRAARAVVTGEGRLDRQTLLGKAVGEVATRARQIGVPCHAIVGDNALSAFDARILDLESVHEAGDPKAIAAAALALVPVLAAD